MSFVQVGNNKQLNDVLIMLMVYDHDFHLESISINVCLYTSNVHTTQMNNLLVM